MNFKKGLLFAVTTICALSLTGCATSDIFFNSLSTLGNNTAGTGVAFAQGSQYKGTYYCGQGLTKLTLSINQVQDTHFQGIFSFYRDEIQQGSFHVHGSFDGNRFVAKPGRWISKPAGYDTVGLIGSYNPQTGGFNGNVDSSGCGTFRLTPVR